MQTVRPSQVVRAGVGTAVHLEWGRVCARATARPHTPCVGGVSRCAMARVLLALHYALASQAVEWW